MVVSAALLVPLAADVGWLTVIAAFVDGGCGPVSRPVLLLAGGPDWIVVIGCRADARDGALGSVTLAARLIEVAFSGGVGAASPLAGVLLPETPVVGRMSTSPVTPPCGDTPGRVNASSVPTSSPRAKPVFVLTPS